MRSLGPSSGRQSPDLDTIAGVHKLGGLAVRAMTSGRRESILRALHPKNPMEQPWPVLRCLSRPASCVAGRYGDPPGWN
jgi:hypothetical protein